MRDEGQRPVTIAHLGELKMWWNFLHESCQDGVETTNTVFF